MFNPLPQTHLAVRYTHIPYISWSMPQAHSHSHLSSLRVLHHLSSPILPAMHFITHLLSHPFIPLSRFCFVPQVVPYSRSPGYISCQCFTQAQTLCALSRLLSNPCIHPWGLSDMCPDIGIQTSSCSAVCSAVLDHFSIVLIL